MDTYFSQINQIFSFVFDTLTDVAALVTGNVILSWSVALFVLAIVTKFFKRLINGK